MEIIVATKFNEQKSPEKNYLPIQITLVLIMITVIFLSSYFQNYYALFLLIPVIFYLWKIQGRNKFGNEFLIAFIQNDHLHIDFEETTLSEKGKIRYGYPLVQLSISLSELVGYKLHSFLGNKPELMEISFKKEDEIFYTRPIPIYYLDKNQLEKFMLFLEENISKS